MINLESRDWSREAGERRPLHPHSSRSLRASLSQAATGLRNSCEKPGLEKAAAAPAQVPTQRAAPWGVVALSAPKVGRGRDGRRDA